MYFVLVFKNEETPKWMQMVKCFVYPFRIKIAKSALRKKFIRNIFIVSSTYTI